MLRPDDDSRGGQLDDEEREEKNCSRAGAKGQGCLLVLLLGISTLLFVFILS
jgi:hypothetical protein